MNIEYVARNYPLDEHIRTFTEDKLEKLVKFLEEPVEIRVTLEQEKHRHIAELHVAHRRGVLQATEENDDMYDAVNLVVDKAEKQARRSRKKSKDKRRRANREEPGWPLEVVERESVKKGSRPRVIETSVLAIKPMNIEEAALQLEDSNNGFVVFRDATSDRISVLYKRKDDNYGLISPEF
jgi:putative sigma-54 modulation protein